MPNEYQLIGHRSPLPKLVAHLQTIIDEAFGRTGQNVAAQGREIMVKISGYAGSHRRVAINVGAGFVPGTNVAAHAAGLLLISPAPTAPLFQLVTTD